MITFTIKPKRDLFISFVDLTDLIAESRKQYKNTMVGPFEDIALESFGIIMDGDNEKMLAEDFEKFLKKKERDYIRTDQIGLLYYEERTF